MVEYFIYKVCLSASYASITRHQFYNHFVIEIFLNLIKFGHAYGTWQFSSKLQNYIQLLEICKLQALSKNDAFKKLYYVCSNTDKSIKRGHWNDYRPQNLYLCERVKHHKQHIKLKWDVFQKCPLNEPKRTMFSQVCAWSKYK